jgi:hypothetical protein
LRRHRDMSSPERAGLHPRRATRPNVVEVSYVQSPVSLLIQTVAGKIQGSRRCALGLATSAARVKPGPTTTTQRFRPLSPNRNSSPPIPQPHPNGNTTPPAPQQVRIPNKTPATTIGHPSANGVAAGAAPASVLTVGAARVSRGGSSLTGISATGPATLPVARDNDNSVSTKVLAARTVHIPLPLRSGGVPPCPTLVRLAADSPSHGGDPRW